MCVIKLCQWRDYLTTTLGLYWSAEKDRFSWLIAVLIAFLEHWGTDGICSAKTNTRKEVWMQGWLSFHKFGIVWRAIISEN